MSVPTILETSASSKQPIGTSKSSFPDFYVHYSSLLLISSVFFACMIMLISSSVILHKLFCELQCFVEEFQGKWRVEIFNIRNNKNARLPFWDVLSQLLTELIFFYWLTLMEDSNWILILSSIVLLILPISVFDGFIKLQEMLWGNWFSNTKFLPTVEDLTKLEQDLSIMIKTNDFKLVSNSF